MGAKDVGSAEDVLWLAIRATSHLSFLLSVSAASKNNRITMFITNGHRDCV